MKLPRLSYDPGRLLHFFQQSLEHLGAVCERTWHDRLELVAEGPAARLWNQDGGLYETALRFVAADEPALRDATREVFPGCPLTFRLAEALQPVPMPLELVILDPALHPGPPKPEVAEKLWRAQQPSRPWRRSADAFAPDYHFSLVALVRCEIQALDQHWSLHRLAVSLPDGQPDPALAADLPLLAVAADWPEPVPWPQADPAAWSAWLQAALADDLAADLASIRTRQETHLRRELDRIADYFENYERELTERAARSPPGATRVRVAERLEAARAEHARRRHDQVQRYSIRVVPHVDTLLLVAERAWRTTVQCAHKARVLEMPARFVPRTRRWFGEHSDNAPIDPLAQVE